MSRLYTMRLLCRSWGLICLRIGWGRWRRGRIYGWWTLMMKGKWSRIFLRSKGLYKRRLSSMIRWRIEIKQFRRSHSLMLRMIRLNRYYRRLRILKQAWINSKLLVEKSQFLHNLDKFKFLSHLLRSFPLQLGRRSPNPLPQSLKKALNQLILQLLFRRNLWSTPAKTLKILAQAWVPKWGEWKTRTVLLT